MEGSKVWSFGRLPTEKRSVYLITYQVTFRLRTLTSTSVWGRRTFSRSFMYKGIGVPP